MFNWELNGTVFGILEIVPYHNDQVKAETYTCTDSHFVNSIVSCSAAVKIIASAPFQGHPRSKQNKHDYSEQILKSVSKLVSGPPAFTTYGYDLHLSCFHFYTKKIKTK